MRRTSTAAKLLAALAPAGALVIAACASSGTTKLTATWKDPTVSTPVRFNRILVAAQARDQSVRRGVEDALTKRIARSTASYTFLSEDDARDPERARPKVEAAGYDGAVVVRLVAAGQQTTYVPGTTWWGPAPYGSMWGYWGYGYGAVYDPGYLQQDMVITLESNVYSVSNQRLVWASRSETFNPDSVQQLIDSVVAATVKEMKKKKVL